MIKNLQIASIFLPQWILNIKLANNLNLHINQNQSRLLIVNYGYKNNISIGKTFLP